MPAAAGIYSTVGTGLAVLLAFLIVGTFDSYETARQAAGKEAVAVQQQYAMASYLNQPYATRLRGDVLCYGRAVISDSWPAMARGQEGQVAQFWVDRTEADMRPRPVEDAKQIEVFAHWLEVTETRQEGRRGRLAEALPFVPQFLWVILVLLIVVVLGFQMLLPTQPPGPGAGGRHRLHGLRAVRRPVADLDARPTLRRPRRRHPPHPDVRLARRDGTHRPRHPPLRRHR